MTDEQLPSSRQDRIAALLAAIPPDERNLFDGYYQRQLEQATQAAYQASQLDPDPDTIEAELVETLLRQIEGRDSQGVGRVPTSPTTTAPIILPTTDPRTTPAAGKGRGGAGTKRGGWHDLSAQQRVVLVAAIAMAFWFIVPGLVSAFGGSGTSDTAEATGQAIPTAGAPDSAATPTPITDVAEAGSDITVAYPASLEIMREDQGADVYRVQASSSTLGGTWKPEVPAGVAAWLNGSYVNYVFCLPPNAATTVQGLARGSRIVMRPASGAVRDFEVLRVRQVERQAIEVFDQRRSGMTLVLCGGDTNQRTVVEAVYQPDPLEQPTIAPGTSVRLADLARITVSTVRVLPPDDTMPVGFTEAQVEVAIENLTTAPLDEQDLVDQLITAEGLAERIGVLHVEVEPKQSRRATFRYRIPLAGDTTARWKVTELGGSSIEVGVTLMMPTTSNRSAYQAQLQPGDVRIRPEERGVTVQLAALVTATGSQPSVLQRGDISVWAGGRSVPVTLQDLALPLTVDPLTPTTVVLTAPLPDISQFDVQIGTQRWRVMLP